MASWKGGHHGDRGRASRGAVSSAACTPPVLKWMRQRRARRHPRQVLPLFCPLGAHGRADTSTRGELHRRPTTPPRQRPRPTTLPVTRPDGTAPTVSTATATQLAVA